MIHWNLCFVYVLLFFSIRRRKAENAQRLAQSQKEAENAKQEIAKLKVSWYLGNCKVW